MKESSKEGKNNGVNGKPSMKFRKNNQIVIIRMVLMND